MSQDPLGFDAGDSNLYRYVNNSPANNSDSSGLSVDPDRIISPEKAIKIAGHGEAFVKKALLTNLGKLGFQAVVSGLLVKSLKMDVNKATDLSKNVLDFLVANKTRAALMKNVFDTWAGGVSAGDANNAFVFTCKQGWIDLGHFWLSALGGYMFGENISYGLGVAVEYIQHLSPTSLPFIGELKALEEWHKSAFTVEDLNSDLLGAKFGASLRDKDYKAILPEFKKVFNSWGPVSIKDPRVLDVLKAEAAFLRKNNVKVKTLDANFVAPIWFGEAHKKLQGHICD